MHERTQFVQFCTRNDTRVQNSRAATGWRAPGQSCANLAFRPFAARGMALGSLSRKVGSKTGRAVPQHTMGQPRSNAELTSSASQRVAPLDELEHGTARRRQRIRPPAVWSRRWQTRCQREFLGRRIKHNRRLCASWLSAQYGDELTFVRVQPLERQPQTVTWTPTFKQIATHCTLADSSDEPIATI